MGKGEATHAEARDEGEADHQRCGRGHCYTHRGDEDEGKDGRIDMRVRVRPRTLEPRTSARPAARDEGEAMCVGAGAEDECEATHAGAKDECEAGR